jgi:6-hydroxycyclohex-1-ene-1-carbonyl-CoA dehydrogenase
MRSVVTRGTAYFLDAPGAALAPRALTLPERPLAPDQALVEVMACGLCHTDLGFADGSVKTRHPLPLILGHEVVGTVVEAGERFPSLVGAPVIVPAVLPCGHCDFCRAGRGNACPSQQMPGNDIHGGFATHLLVPAAPLVRVDDAPPGFPLEELSVVADAVSTAYQAVRRSCLAAGDAAFVVGAGGVGGFVAQIAAALGAHVLACDVSPARLEAAARYGAETTLDVSAATPHDARKAAHGAASEWKVPSLRYRIFECSGTPAGQQLAFGLLARGATLLQVGYTPKTVDVRLSNLMAFDATVHGTWGCPPESYPEVLRLVYGGKVALSPFVERAPMSRLNALLGDMAQHRLTRRMILDPTA